MTHQIRETLIDALHCGRILRVKVYNKWSLLIHHRHHYKFISTPKFHRYKALLRWKAIIRLFPLNNIISLISDFAPSKKFLHLRMLPSKREKGGKLDKIIMLQSLVRDLTQKLFSGFLRTRISKKFVRGRKCFKKCFNGEKGQIFYLP